MILLVMTRPNDIAKKLWLITKMKNTTLVFIFIFSSHKTMKLIKVVISSKILGRLHDFFGVKNICV